MITARCRCHGGRSLEQTPTACLLYTVCETPVRPADREAIRQELRQRPRPRRRWWQRWLRTAGMKERDPGRVALDRG